MFIFIFILLCCVTYFAMSIERTWPDLYSVIECDKKKNTLTLYMYFTTLTNTTVMYSKYYNVFLIIL